MSRTVIKCGNLNCPHLQDVCCPFEVCRLPEQERRRMAIDQLREVLLLFNLTDGDFTKAENLLSEESVKK